MIEYGITTEEAIEAVQQFNKLLTLPDETDIELVKKNPSLNSFQKWWIIRKIRKWNIATSQPK